MSFLQDKFRYWLDYDAETGDMFWKHSPGVVPAGAPVNAQFKLTYQGFSKANAIVCMCDGRYPVRVKFKNGDRGDYRFCNLEPSFALPIKPVVLPSLARILKLYRIQNGMLVNAAGPYKGQQAIDHITLHSVAKLYIDGAFYNVIDVMHYIVHGQVPPGRLFPLDGNKLNLDLQNWSCNKPLLTKEISNYPYVYFSKRENVWVAQRVFKDVPEGLSGIRNGVYKFKCNHATEEMAFASYLWMFRKLYGKDVEGYADLKIKYAEALASDRPIPYRVILPRFKGWKPSEFQLELHG